MTDDVLDKETSVSVELTESGVKAKAKSRTVAALDRLGGNLSELLNVRMERHVTRERAIITGEKKMIEAAVEYGIDRLKKDPDFAERVAEKHLRKIFHRQDNKDAVLVEAIEDLRHDPLTDAEAEAGPAELNPEFMDRFERYAEDASTEELRQKWGRVLSAEIRKPGTFSRKALRVVEELDAQTAQLFERLCRSRLENVFPKSLVGELSFAEAASLVTADLMVDPGAAGQIRQSVLMKASDERELWFVPLGEYAIAFQKDINLGQPGAAGTGPAAVLRSNKDNNPVLPVYVLTSTGQAVAEILPNHRREALLALLGKLRKYWPHEDILALEWMPSVSSYQVSEM
ncbi:DUF2806 domain-containing protein [Bradyrhizobium valentinum]|uniref:DUF2806 domain-containing protein n=1 Tax=Bradyrhizobium valentinum TaxID=1518501 RepID=A0A0R3M380_9BRAD|nr:DUF2806 domain-containing protein [Bradyrhizobium valentinum]KRR14754.1 hypothetical protein CP49_31065 [Bradyrhizobium valentinum]